MVGLSRGFTALMHHVSIMYVLREPASSARTEFIDIITATLPAYVGRNYLRP